MIIDLRMLHGDMLDKELKKWEGYTIYFDREVAKVDCLYANEESGVLIHHGYDREKNILKQHGKVIYIQRYGKVEIKKK